MFKENLYKLRKTYRDYTVVEISRLLDMEILEVEGSEKVIANYGVMETVKIPRRDEIIEEIMKKLDSAKKPKLSDGKFTSNGGLNLHTIKTKVISNLDFELDNYVQGKEFLNTLRTIIDSDDSDDNIDINIILYGIIPLYFQKPENVDIDIIKNILTAYKVDEQQIIDAVGEGKPGRFSNILKHLKKLNKVKFYEKILEIYNSENTGQMLNQGFIQAINLIIEKEQAMKGGYTQYGGENISDDDRKYLIPTLHLIRSFITNALNYSDIFDNLVISIFENFRVDDENYHILTEFLKVGNEYSAILKDQYPDDTEHDEVVKVLEHLKNMVDSFRELYDFATALNDIYRGIPNDDEFIKLIDKYREGKVQEGLGSDIDKINLNVEIREVSA